MTRIDDAAAQQRSERDDAGALETTVRYLAVGSLRADDDAETCLRPLGLCELGGSCDTCWYRPDHPRFRR